MSFPHNHEIDSERYYRFGSELLVVQRTVEGECANSYVTHMDYSSLPVARSCTILFSDGSSLVTMISENTDHKLIRGQDLKILGFGTCTGNGFFPT